MCSVGRFLQDDSHVLFPFGYGLSYTTFSYSSLTVVTPGDIGCEDPGDIPAACVTVIVTNTGLTGFNKPAEHVVPLYLSHTVMAVRVATAAPVFAFYTLALKATPLQLVLCVWRCALSTSHKWSTFMQICIGLHCFAFFTSARVQQMSHGASMARKLLSAVLLRTCNLTSTA